MSKGEGPAESPISTKSIAVAAIVIARYLRARDPAFAAYLSASLRHAEESGLDESDLSLLQLLVDSSAAPGAGDEFK